MPVAPAAHVSVETSLFVGIRTVGPTPQVTPLSVVLEYQALKSTSATPSRDLPGTISYSQIYGIIVRVTMLAPFSILNGITGCKLKVLRLPLLLGPMLSS